MSSSRRIAEGLGLTRIKKALGKIEEVMNPEEEEGVDYHADELEEIVLEDYEDDAFYKDVDKIEGYENNHRLALQLDSHARPRLAGLVDTCMTPRKEAKVLFEQGMWVEYRSNDMLWKVGLVNKVVKQAPDSWDYETDGEPPPSAYNIYYNVGVEGLMDVNDLRAPTKGLELIFGKRPWLWQQFTLLQLEKRIRFQESHEYDFDEIDCQEFASDRFDAWLQAPQNSDFKELFDAQPDIAQALLKDNLLTPFVLCDKIVEDPETWDFDDPDISIYTYTSVFGAGITMTFLAFAIQIISPLIILYNAMFLVDGERNPRFDLEVDLVDLERDAELLENPVPIGGGFLPTTTFEQFCKEEDNRNPRVEGKFMIVIVLLVYVATILPDSILSWYRTSGGADSTYSRINSLRMIIYIQNDDDILQQIGYKLDRIMNTGYVSVIYTIMLFILIQTPIILDIILNALAIEFIHEIDEKIANSDWYDEGNRWIRAGTIELVIQATLRLRILDNPKALCKEYEIDLKEYVAALDGKKSLCNKTIAEEDDNDYRYMTLKERQYKFVAIEAQKKDNDFAYEQYHKQLVQFGFFDLIGEKIGYRKKGVFNRYPEFRTWSRWEKILFLPEVPPIDAAESSVAIHEKRAVEVRIGMDDYSEFVIHVVQVISGYETATAMITAGANHNWMQIPIKFLFGISEIFFYLAQLFFPFFIPFALYLIPYCY